MLAALAPQLTGELRVRGLEATLASARQAIADHLLKNLSATKREEVLKFCADEKLYAPPLLDQDTLAAIAGQIVEVCEEWRWM